MEGAAFRRAFVAFDHTGRGYVRLEDVLKELGPGEVADTFCELLAAVNGEGEEITLKTFIAALSVGMSINFLKKKRSNQSQSVTCFFFCRSNAADC